MQRAKWMFVGVFLLVAGPLFAQVNVAGDWEITLKTPQGDSTAMATLKQDGEKVSGVLKNQMGELPFDGGTLTGDELKFVFTVNFQGTPIPITLTGKVKGTTIDGQADFGGMAQGDWTGKRVESTTANAAAAPAAGTPAAAPAPAATGGTISGTWDVTFRTPQGDFPAVATITVESGKLSGSMGSQLGETPITGTIDGAKLTIAITVESPQGSMNVSMTGELQGSDAMVGMADVAGMGQMEWSAKRSRQ
jgi:hypothetical protein